MSNPYEEFLEATKEKPLVTLSRHLARYVLARASSTFMSYPWEAAIILRQIQCPTDSQTPITPREKSNEEKRKEYEEYLLRPHGSVKVQGEKVRKDVNGYVELETNYHMILDASQSLLWTVQQCTKLEGLGSLWQGASVWNAKKIAGDIIADGILPILPVSTHDSIITNAAIAAGTAFFLNPLDVAHTRLVIQTPFERTYNNVLAVFRQSPTTELFAGSIYNSVARGFESFFTTAISKFGCVVVDRIGISSYTWLSVCHFLVNSVAANLPLLLSVPLDTMRRRAVMTLAIRTSRVPMRPNWPVREQLSRPQDLFHGLTYRIATNTALLLIHLLSELEGEWLGGGEEF